MNLRPASSSAAPTVPTTVAAAAWRGPRTERYSMPVAAPAASVLTYGKASRKQG